MLSIILNLIVIQSTHVEFIECNSIMLDERSYMIKAIVAQNRLSYFVAASSDRVQREGKKYTHFATRFSLHD